ncbi:uncharacterized protein LOC124282589 isoform X2 [Haliotis rubra]|nr:uncharacterized protein LOC124282589 isoform X2 [Haliotis rubra]XP_046574554.1 uncharacterized protein LOC124282589 isoform X2 [Haliotis rubra]
MPLGTKRFCKICHSRLKFYQINFNEAIQLCENKACCFPLESSTGSISIQPRDFSHVPVLKRKSSSTRSVKSSFSTPFGTPTVLSPTFSLPTCGPWTLPELGPGSVEFPYVDATRGSSATPVKAAASCLDGNKEELDLEGLLNSGAFDEPVKFDNSSCIVKDFKEPLPLKTQNPPTVAVNNGLNSNCSDFTEKYVSRSSKCVSRNPFDELIVDFDENTSVFPLDTELTVGWATDVSNGFGLQELTNGLSFHQENANISDKQLNCASDNKFNSFHESENSLDAEVRSIFESSKLIFEKNNLWSCFSKDKMMAPIKDDDTGVNEAKQESVGEDTTNEGTVQEGSCNIPGENVTCEPGILTGSAGALESTCESGKEELTPGCVSNGENNLQSNIESQNPVEDVDEIMEPAPAQSVDSQSEVLTMNTVGEDTQPVSVSGVQVTDQPPAELMEYQDQEDIPENIRNDNLEQGFVLTESQGEQHSPVAQELTSQEALMHVDNSEENPDIDEFGTSSVQQLETVQIVPEAFSVQMDTVIQDHEGGHSVTDFHGETEIVAAALDDANSADATGEGIQVAGEPFSDNSQGASEVKEDSRDDQIQGESTESQTVVAEAVDTIVKETTVDQFEMQVVPETEEGIVLEEPCHAADNSDVLCEQVELSSTVISEQGGVDTAEEEVTEAALGDHDTAVATVNATNVEFETAITDVPNHYEEVEPGQDDCVSAPVDDVQRSVETVQLTTAIVSAADTVECEGEVTSATHTVVSNVELSQSDVCDGSQIVDAGQLVGMIQNETDLVAGETVVGTEENMLIQTCETFIPAGENLESERDIEGTTNSDIPTVGVQTVEIPCEQTIVACEEEVAINHTVIESGSTEAIQDHHADIRDGAGAVSPSSVSVAQGMSVITGNMEESGVTGIAPQTFEYSTIGQISETIVDAQPFQTIENVPILEHEVSEASRSLIATEMLAAGEMQQPIESFMEETVESVPGQEPAEVMSETAPLLEHDQMTQVVVNNAGMEVAHHQDLQLEEFVVPVSELTGSAGGVVENQVVSVPLELVSSEIQGAESEVPISYTETLMGVHHVVVAQSEALYSQEGSEETMDVHQVGLPSQSQGMSEDMILMNKQHLVETSVHTVQPNTIINMPVSNQSGIFTLASQTMPNVISCPVISTSVQEQPSSHQSSVSQVTSTEAQTSQKIPILVSESSLTTLPGSIAMTSPCSEGQDSVSTTAATVTQQDNTTQGVVSHSIIPTLNVLKYLSNVTSAAPKLPGGPGEIAEEDTGPVTLLDKKCLNLFIQWQNKDAMCWLDVVMIVLCNSVTIQKLFTDEKSAESVKDSVLTTLLKAYYQAQTLMQKLTAKEQEDHKEAVAECLAKEAQAESAKAETVRVDESASSTFVQNGESLKLDNTVEPNTEAPTVKSTPPDAQLTGEGQQTQSETTTRVSRISVKTLTEYSKAMDILDNIREKIWDVLQPRLQCERGKNDSPLFALPLLVREPAVLKEKFKIKFKYTFTCDQCSYHQDDDHSKILPSFPQVPADFNMKEPCFVRNCFQCNAPGKRMKMTFKSVPDVLLLHFKEGLPHSGFDQLGFVFGTDVYTVTAVIQYKNNPDHFVAWIRNGTGNQWMECDDLKSTLCQYTTELPAIPPNQVHIIMWEKNVPSHNAARDLVETPMANVLQSCLRIIQPDFLSSSNVVLSAKELLARGLKRKAEVAGQNTVKYILSQSTGRSLPGILTLPAGSSSGGVQTMKIVSLPPTSLAPGVNPSVAGLKAVATTPSQLLTSGQILQAAATSVKPIILQSKTRPTILSSTSSAVSNAPGVYQILQKSQLTSSPTSSQTSLPTMMKVVQSGNKLVCLPAEKHSDIQGTTVVNEKQLAPGSIIVGNQRLILPQTQNVTGKQPSPLTASTSTQPNLQYIQLDKSHSLVPSSASGGSIHGTSAQTGKLPVISALKDGQGTTTLLAQQVGGMAKTYTVGADGILQEVDKDAVGNESSPVKKQRVTVLKGSLASTPSTSGPKIIVKKKTESGEIVESIVTDLDQQQSSDFMKAIEALKSGDTQAGTLIQQLIKRKMTNQPQSFSPVVSDESQSSTDTGTMKIINVKPATQAIGPQTVQIPGGNIIKKYVKVGDNTIQVKSPDMLPVIERGRGRGRGRGARKQKDPPRPGPTINNQTSAESPIDLTSLQSSPEAMRAVSSEPQHIVIASPGQTVHSGIKLIGSPTSQGNITASKVIKLLSGSSKDSQLIGQLAVNPATVSAASLVSGRPILPQGQTVTTYAGTSLMSGQKLIPQSVVTSMGSVASLISGQKLIPQVSTLGTASGSVLVSGQQVIPQVQTVTSPAPVASLVSGQKLLSKLQTVTGTAGKKVTTLLASHVNPEHKATPVKKGVQDKRKPVLSPEKSSPVKFYFPSGKPIPSSQSPVGTISQASQPMASSSAPQCISLSTTGAMLTPHKTISVVPNTPSLQPVTSLINQRPQQRTESQISKGSLSSPTSPSAGGASSLSPRSSVDAGQSPGGFSPVADVELLSDSDGSPSPTKTPTRGPVISVRGAQGDAALLAKAIQDLMKQGVTIQQIQTPGFLSKLLTTMKSSVHTASAPEGTTAKSLIQTSHVTKKPVPAVAKSQKPKAVVKSPSHTVTNKAADSQEVLPKLAMGNMPATELRSPGSSSVEALSPPKPLSFSEESSSDSDLTTAKSAVIVKPGQSYLAAVKPFLKLKPTEPVNQSVFDGYKLKSGTVISTQSKPVSGFTTIDMQRDQVQGKDGSADTKSTPVITPVPVVASSAASQIISTSATSQDSLKAAEPSQPSQTVTSPEFDTGKAVKTAAKSSKVIKTITPIKMQPMPSPEIKAAVKRSIVKTDALPAKVTKGPSELMVVEIPTPGKSKKSNPLDLIADAAISRLTVQKDSDVEPLPEISMPPKGRGRGRGRPPKNVARNESMETSLDLAAKNPEPETSKKVQELSGPIKKAAGHKRSFMDAFDLPVVTDVLADAIPVSSVSTAVQGAILDAVVGDVQSTAETPPLNNGKPIGKHNPGSIDIVALPETPRSRGRPRKQATVPYDTVTPKPPAGRGRSPQLSPSAVKAPRLSTDTSTATDVPNRMSRRQSSEEAVKLDSPETKPRRRPRKQSAETRDKTPAESPTESKTVGKIRRQSSEASKEVVQTLKESRGRGRRTNTPQAKGSARKQSLSPSARADKTAVKPAAEDGHTNLPENNSKLKPTDAKPTSEILVVSEVKYIGKYKILPIERPNTRRFRNPVKTEEPNQTEKEDNITPAKKDSEKPIKRRGRPPSNPAKRAKKE